MKAKFEQKSFTEPACGQNVTQEEWDRIFGKKDTKKSSETTGEVKPDGNSDALDR